MNQVEPGEYSERTLFWIMICISFVDGALRITNIPTFYLWKDFLGLSPGMNCCLR